MKCADWEIYSAIYVTHTQIGINMNLFIVYQGNVHDDATKTHQKHTITRFPVKNRALGPSLPHEAKLDNPYDRFCVILPRILP